MTVDGQTYSFKTDGMFGSKMSWNRRVRRLRIW